MLTLISLLTRYTSVWVGIVSFLVGLWTAAAWTEIRHAKQLLDIQAQVVKQQEYNRKVITSLQEVNAKADVKYNKLKEKLNETVVTNVPCKLTTAAVRLWNQSKGTESQLPKDTSGTTEAPTPSNPIEGVGVKLVLENAQENDKICNGLRSQIESIIKWDNDTFGK